MLSLNAKLKRYILRGLVLDCEINPSLLATDFVEMILFVLLIQEGQLSVTESMNTLNSIFYVFHDFLCFSH